MSPDDGPPAGDSPADPPPAQPGEPPSGKSEETPASDARASAADEAPPDESLADDTPADESGPRGETARQDTDGAEPVRGGPRRNGGTTDDGGIVHRFRTAETGGLALLREMLTSVGLVLLVAGLLFGASGVWPPMVAVESGSMNPHMYRGDLVFIVEEDRLAGSNAVEGTGIVPHRAAVESGYRKFGDHGDVIIYRPNNQTRGQSPIIHRARFYVEEDENWYDRADEDHIRADSCQELRNCPAPNEGFITKGDNPQTNRYYDQVQGRSRPVKPSWIEGKAMVRIPGLGHIRLAWGELQRGALFVAATGALVVGSRRRPVA